MYEENEEFLRGLVRRLDETLRQLALEEQELIRQMGNARIDELLEFWKKELSDEDEGAFKMAMDYWDKIVIRTWARLKRVRHTRAEVFQTLKKLTGKHPMPLS